MLGHRYMLTILEGAKRAMTNWRSKNGWSYVAPGRPKLLAHPLFQVRKSLLDHGDFLGSAGVLEVFAQLRSFIRGIFLCLINLSQQEMDARIAVRAIDLERP